MLTFSIMCLTRCCRTTDGSSEDRTIEVVAAMQAQERHQQLAQFAVHQLNIRRCLAILISEMNRFTSFYKELVEALGFNEWLDQHTHAGLSSWSPFYSPYAFSNFCA